MLALPSSALIKMQRPNNPGNDNSISDGPEGQQRGRQYETKILMLFFKRGHFENFSFKLGTQVDIGEKFDDVVFKYEVQGETYHRFLQAKNLRDESKKITSNVLLSEQSSSDSNDSLCDYFNLQKYFVSYLKIRRVCTGDSVEDVIIFTNIGFDLYELSRAGIQVEILNTPDNILDLTAAKESSALYRLKVERNNQLYKVLKETSHLKSLAREIIKHTFDENENTRTIRVDKNPIFQAYHLALVNEVIDVSSNRKEGRFKENFIKCQNLSERAKTFRHELLKVGMKDTEETFWEDIGKRKLKITKGFGHGLEGNNELPNDVINDADIQDFLKHLIFAVNQPNSDQLSELIENEIKAEFNLINTDFIMSSLEKVIESWVNERKDKEGWISSKESKDFFGKAKEAIIASQVAGITLENKRRISNTAVEFQTPVPGLSAFLQSNEYNVLHLATSLENVLLSSIKLCQFLKHYVNFRRDDSHIFVELSGILDGKVQRNVEEAFKSTRNDLLILQCNSEDPRRDVRVLYEHLSDVMRNNSNKKVILIGEGDNTHVCLFDQSGCRCREEQDDAIGFGDLTLGSQEKLLQSEVMFQGQKVTFSDLVGETFRNIIDIPTLLRIVKNEEIVRVGRKLQSLCDLEAVFSRCSDQISIDNLREEIEKGPDASVFFMIFDNRRRNTEIEDNQSHPLLVIPEKGIEKLLSIANGSENAVIIDNETSDVDSDCFMQLCHDHPERTIHWVELDNLNITWKRIYYPNFYLQREFSHVGRIVLKKDIKKYLTQAHHSEILIFSAVTNQKELIDLFHLSENEEKKLEGNVSVVLKTSEADANVRFQELSTCGKSVHWIKLERGELVWQKSHGSLNALRRYMDKEKSTNLLLREEEFATNVKDKVVIIADEPGMGKSTTLVSLSERLKKRNKSDWILRLDLKDCEKAIDSLPSQSVINMKVTIIFFSKVDLSGLGTSFAKDLMKHHFLDHQRSPMILFDGFDEIDEMQQEKILKLLKFLKAQTSAKVWITSRPYKMDTLENNLSVFSTRFQELCFEKRSEFLKNFWKVRFKLLLSQRKFLEAFTQEDDKHCKFEEFSKALFDRVEKTLGGKISRFMGIPLQLRLFAEVYHDEFLSFIQSGASELPYFPKFHVLDIYRRFIDTKYNIYCKEKQKLSNNDFLKKLLVKAFNEQHQCFAFSLLFRNAKQTPILLQKHNRLSEDDENGMKSVGIVQSAGRSGAPYFIHKTFAEYFAAEFIAEKLNSGCRNEPEYKTTIEFLLEHSFKRENEILCFFLDHLSTQDLPIHSAILNEGSLSEIKHFLPENTINDSDIFLKRIKGLRTRSFSAVNVPALPSDRLGRTPLHFSAQVGNYDVLMELLLMGYDIKMLDDLGRTGLHYAAGYGRLRILNFFLKFTFGSDVGVTLNFPIISGRKYFALDYEKNIFKKMHNERFSILDEYLKKQNYFGSDFPKFINFLDKSGQSALHYAVQRENWHFAGLLIFHGADSHWMSDEDINILISRYPRDKMLPKVEAVLVPKIKIPDAVFNYDCSYISSTSPFCTSVHRGTTVIRNILKKIEEKRKTKFFKLMGGSISDSLVDEINKNNNFSDEDHLKVVKLLTEEDIIDRKGDEMKYILESVVMKGHLETLQHLFTKYETLIKNYFCASLMYCAAKCNCFNIIDFLWQNFRPFTSDKCGNTALHTIAHGGFTGVSLNIMKYLIENGADVNSQNADSETPLHMAAVHDSRLHVVKFLVENGANVNVVDNRNKTALYYAVKNVQIDISSYLMTQCRSDVIFPSKYMKLFVDYINAPETFEFNIVEENGTPLLQLFVKLDERKLVTFLLEGGADVNILDSGGCSPLHWAAGLPHVEMVRLLLWHGAIYDIRNKSGDIPADLATQSNKHFLEKVDQCFNNINQLVSMLNVMRYVDCLGVVARARNSNGNTLLHLIVESNDLYAVICLCEFHGVTCETNPNKEFSKVLDFDAKNLQGDTPLHLAARKGNDKIVQFLSDQGIVFNSKNQFGYTPKDLAENEIYEDVVDKLKSYETFFCSVKQNRVKEIKTFLKERMRYFKARDENGMTPLHWAANNGCIEIASLLVEMGANIEALDNRSWTPLHHAANSDHVKTVQWLLQKGAIFNPKDKKRKTPLDLAQPRNSNLLVLVTALFNDVHHDSLQVISKLQDIKKDVELLRAVINTRDNQLNTLLHYAAREDYFEIAQFLLQNGSNSYVTNNMNQFPKDLAHDRNIFTLFSSIR